ncbi:MAG: response regulator transcription factor [Bacteroidales bacterium]
MIPPIRVAIVNDNRETRKSIRVFLEQKNDFVIVAEAQSGIEFLELAKRVPIDVVLVDSSLPLINGVTGSYHIDKSRLPFLQIVLVSMQNNMDYLMAMIETGTMSESSNQTVFMYLERAIRSVASNKIYYGNPYSNYNYALN